MTTNNFGEELIEIVSDRSLIDKYINYPEIGINDNSYLDFELYELFLAYEKSANGNSANETQEEEMYETEISIEDDNDFKQEIKKDFYYSIARLLSDSDGNFDEKSVANLCHAALRIDTFNRSYLYMREHEEEGEFENKKEYAKKLVKSINLIEEINQKDYNPFEIKKITIQTGVGISSKSTIFSTELFLIFESFFRKHFPLNSNMNSKIFLSDVKNDCETFLKTYKKSSVKESMILQEYANSLNDLLIEMGMKIPNNRHGIIGHVFSLIKIFPPRSYMDNKARFDKSKLTQVYADRVKQIINRRNK
ncbi:MAG: hypothetical protein WCP52_02085 [Bacteroidota bacterium]